MNDKLELFLCHAIEKGLSDLYEHDLALTEGLCIIGLDNAVIALKQQFGFARNETVLHRPGVDGVVEHVMGVGLAHIGNTEGLTLKEYIVVVHKIRRSVVRHAELGPGAYFNFIREYV